MAGREEPSLDEADVLRFLVRRPDFLQRHPTLYMTLDPPARVHGEALADHMAAMIVAVRRQNAGLRTDVAARRHASGLRARVEDAVLGLLRARDTLEWVEVELAPTLGLDAAHLWRCGSGQAIPEALARQLLGGRDVSLRGAGGSAGLHGAAASLVRSEALVRVAGHSGLAVLALGSREERFFAPGAEAPLQMLGRAVEAALDRQ